VRDAPRAAVPLLAAVLALNSADVATVGSTATRLQQDLHLSYTDLGLVVSLSSLVGAFAALPFGVLADRVARIHTLSVAVVLWGVGAAATGAAVSFGTLMSARVASGVVLAAAGPLSASLVGDWFPPAERGQIYGRLLTGELVGTGIGFALTGNLAGLLSWRAAFLALAPASFALAVLLWRLPEPERCRRRPSQFSQMHEQPQAKSPERTEFAQTDRVQREAVQTEPGQTEPGQTEPVQTESVGAAVRAAKASGATPDIVLAKKFKKI